MPAADVEAAGASLLAGLLRHAVTRTEAYQRLAVHLDASAEDDPAAWASIPILSLEAWRGLGQAGRATDLPDGEQVLPGGEAWVTVSTPLDSPHGRLVEIADAAQWQFLIHDRRLDTAGRLVAILPESVLRPGDLAEPFGPWALDARSGRANRWSDRFDAGQTLAWLENVRPACLFADNRTIERLLATAGARDLTIDDILLWQPALSRSLADGCRNIFGARLIEVIASPACGFVASGRDDGSFAPALETCWVEIVDEAGRCCETGEPGCLIATALYSYHRPVIRLDLGLRAAWDEAGPSNGPVRRGFRLLDRL